MTELSDRLRREIEDGRSLREIGRKAGLSATTVRKVLLGKEIDRSTVDKLARYFRLPTEEIYRMAEILPSMYTADGRFNRDWLLSKLWEVISSLPDTAQAMVMAEALRLQQEYGASPEKPNSNDTRTGIS